MDQQEFERLLRKAMATPNTPSTPAEEQTGLECQPQGGTAG